ncbi:MAG: T9SS type A sorting domain-containing protein [Bacteroidota bacterium]
MSRLLYFFLLLFFTDFAYTQIRLQPNQIVTAPSPTLRENFGTSVAVTDRYALVGAYRKQTGSGVTTGAAYLYERVGSAWQLLKELIPADAQSGDGFGFSVDLTNDYALIGAWGSGVDGRGAAYLFHRNEGGDNNWGEVQKLQADNISANDRFGYSVALEDNRALIGAYQKGQTDDAGFPLFNTGAAYLFEQNSNGRWTEIAQFFAPDFAEDDNFGISVDLENRYVLIGADGKNSGAGAVYLFENQSDSDWMFLQKLEASNPKTNSFFGWSLNINFERIAIGAFGEDEQTGAVYIFNRNMDNQWQQTQRLSVESADDAFGISVNMYTDYLLIGAHQRVNEMTNEASGAAYLFLEDSEQQWQPLQTIQPWDTAAEDGFGISLALTEQHALIGAWKKSLGADAQVEAGAAYFFDAVIINTTAVNEVATTTLYPNPCHHELYLSTTESLPFQIINAMGQVVHSGIYASKSITVHTLPAGFYYLKIANRAIPFLKVDE